ncbi:secretion protein HlyD [Sphingopyxis sp. MG]|uniref:secretion protein HlyD n=1 Tax=Sphingopyxis sp. MG TaxID=1866325 RepID=UPI000CDF437E|nr:secretion protein HlyD [Sphingopyxis sp. MG]AVA15029.1 secretion protein HlyD [Sphingopyxis sp. MG]
MKRIRLSGVARWIVIVAIVVAIATAGWLWMQRGDRSDEALRLYGNVDIREVQLAFRQSGRVAQMHFDEGDHVETGAHMATLDAQPYREALAAADAAVAVAQADVDKLHRGLRPQEIAQTREALNQALVGVRETQRNFDRQSQLLASGAASQKTVDAARAARDQAAAGASAARAAHSQAAEGFRKEDVAAGQARLAAAQAARAQAATALADTVLLAPRPGTVIARVREPGSMVISQTPIYNVSLNAPVYVRAYIGELDLGRIAPGMRVRVRSDSSDKVYQGQIGFISPRAEFTPKTVETTDLRTDLVYRLRIVVTNADAALRQGMPVTIDVDAGQVSSAHTKGR